MDRNSKTVMLAALGTVILLVLVGCVYAYWRETMVVRCSDGTTHPRMNTRAFETRYTGYTAKIEAQIEQKGSFDASVGSQKLQEMTDAIQQARLHMQALADGYNACAVDVSEFNDAKNRYQRMEDIAREVNELSSHRPLQNADQDRIRKLVDEYIGESRSTTRAK